MTEIKLVKRYPHLKDEDVTSIFQEGYIKGFENGRKGAIPIEWIKKWCNEEHNRKSLEERLLKRYGVITMLEDWEKEKSVKISEGNYDSDEEYEEQMRCLNETNRCG